MAPTIASNVPSTPDSGSSAGVLPALQMGGVMVPSSQDSYHRGDDSSDSMSQSLSYTNPFGPWSGQNAQSFSQSGNASVELESNSETVASSSHQSSQPSAGQDVAEAAALMTSRDTPVGQGLAKIVPLMTSGNLPVASDVSQTLLLTSSGSPPAAPSTLQASLSVASDALAGSSQVEADKVPDETSYQIGEQIWDREHPPVMFGMLDPPQNVRELKNFQPGWVLGPDGRKVKGSDGQPLRDLPILPRFIGSENEPMELEYYFRVDPRVGYGDIRARQAKWKGHDEKATPGGRGRNNPLRRPNNSINNARRRMVREPLNMRDWSIKHEGRGSKILIVLLDNLTLEQIQHNTTWVITQDGIHPPTNPFHLFPHFAFLDDGKFPHKPSPEVQRGLDILERVRQLAVEHGLPSWKDLPRNLLPDSWYKPKRLGKGRQSLVDEDDDEDADGDTDVSEGSKRPQKKRAIERTPSISSTRGSGSQPGGPSYRRIAPRPTSDNSSQTQNHPQTQPRSSLRLPPISTVRPRVPNALGAASIGPGGLYWFPEEVQLIRDLRVVAANALHQIMEAARSWRNGRATRLLSYSNEAFQPGQYNMAQVHCAMDLALLDSEHWEYCRLLYNERLGEYNGECNQRLDGPQNSDLGSNDVDSAQPRFGEFSHGVQQASHRLQEATMRDDDGCPVQEPTSRTRSALQGHHEHRIVYGDHAMATRQTSALPHHYGHFYSQPHYYEQATHFGMQTNPHGLQMPIQSQNHQLGGYTNGYAQQTPHHGGYDGAAGLYGHQHIQESSGASTPTQTVHQQASHSSSTRSGGENTQRSVQVHPAPVPRRPTNWQRFRRSAPVPIAVLSSGYSAYFANNPQPLRTLRRSLPNYRQSVSSNENGVGESSSDTERTDRSIVETAARHMMQMRQNAGSRRASDSQLMPPPPVPSNGSAQQIVHGSDDAPEESSTRSEPADEHTNDVPTNDVPD